MPDPSDFRHHLLPETEMLHRFSQHDMEQTLSRCSVEETLVDQGYMHHAFCCTINLLEYFEPGTGIQVATLYQQTYVDNSRTPVRFIRMFRVGTDVYILEPAATV